MFLWEIAVVFGISSICFTLWSLASTFRNTEKTLKHLDENVQLMINIYLTKEKSQKYFSLHNPHYRQLKKKRKGERGVFFSFHY